MGVGHHASLQGPRGRVYKMGAGIPTRAQRQGCLERTEEPRQPAMSQEWGSLKAWRPGAQYWSKALHQPARLKRWDGLERSRLPLSPWRWEASREPCQIPEGGQPRGKEGSMLAHCAQDTQ